jgi:hypothetical protein
MTITTILLTVFGALLVAAYALWDFGGDRLVAGFGRLVIRTLTFGGVRIAEDADERVRLWRFLLRQFSCFFCLFLSSLHACTDVDSKPSNQSMKPTAPFR